MKQKTKWGKYTTYDDKDHQCDDNFDVTGIKENNPQKFGDSESWSKNASQKSFHRSNFKYSNLSAYGSRERSKGSGVIESEYFGQENMSNGGFNNAYCGQSREDKTKSYINEYSFQQRDRTGVGLAKSFTGSSNLPSFIVRNKNEQRSGKSKNENILESSKWDMFEENNTATQNSNTESVPDSMEDVYDSRPYVTFDPEEIASIDKSVPVSLEQLKEPQEINLGESDTNETKVHNEINKSGVHSSSNWKGVFNENTANSKWSCFISNKITTQSLGYSENDASSSGAFKLIQEENAGVTNYKQNVESEISAGKENLILNRKSSKWETFTESCDSSDAEITKKTFFGDSKATGKHWNDLTKGSLVCQEDDKRGFSKFSITTSKSDTVTPVFSVGELDDADFEL